MSRKKEFRTRKRGTGGQVGQRFPIGSHDSSSLPTALKQVTQSEPLRQMEADAQTQEELESLQSQIEYAIQQEEYSEAKEMAERYHKLKAIIEQPPQVGMTKKDKMKIALKKIGEKIDEIQRKALEWEETLDKELS